MVHTEIEGDQKFIMLFRIEDRLRFSNVYSKEPQPSYARSSSTKVTEVSNSTKSGDHPNENDSDSASLVPITIPATARTQEE